MLGVGGATYRFDCPPVTAGSPRKLETTNLSDRFTPSTPQPAIYSRTRFASAPKPGPTAQLAAWGRSVVANLSGNLAAALALRDDKR